jgi:alpha-D-xyloside xylohydrolase
MCCPLFRQHGDRATEIWLYGDVAEAAITKVIALRYSLLSYFTQQMALSSETGMPFNRPLWFDFPQDPVAWNTSTANQFMVGAHYMVAPVLEPGATTWSAYLPQHAGGGTTRWKHYFSGKVYPGGQAVEVAAPLGEFPLFELLD